MSVVYLISVLLVVSGGVIPDNMGFEVMDDEGLMPVNWVFSGVGYSGSSDSAVVFSGDRSFRIEYEEDGDYFGCISQLIPFTYCGESITLSGDLHTENMGDDCLAGLCLFLYNSEGRRESFELLYPEELQSDADWQRFELTMENSCFGDTLELGVYLMGPGTIWADDLELLLDGEPVDLAVERALPGAELDHEFDSGSGLDFLEVKDFQTESLVLLGKVWAFLKYHHPEIGRGDVNWDYSLMRALPSVLEASTVPERQQAILDLVEGLEPVAVAECVVPAPEDIHLSPDLSWIDETEVGFSLAAALWNVYEGRWQGAHYYVRGAPHSIFNECEYEDMDIPDTGFRLLALYRYWGIIEYYFPYIYAIDGDWDDVLRTFIPVFTAADTPLSYQLALQKLIVSICDSHAILLDEPDPLREFYGNFCVPLKLARVEEQWVVAGYTHESAAASGIEPGDVIAAVDGQSAADRAEELYPFTSGSTEASLYERLGRNLLRGNTETFSLTFQRGDEMQVVIVEGVEWEEVNQDLAKTPAVGADFYTIMEDGTAYVYAAMLEWNGLDEMKTELRGTSRLILDLRDYPAGFVIHDMAGFLLPEETVFARIARSDYSNPGTFYSPESVYTGGGETSVYEGRIAILIDEGSPSLAEFTAMAWRLAPQARVFGSPSAGADGDVVFVSFPGAIQTRFTGIGIYNPDGSETQRVGIIPDVEVRPTVAGMQAGRDEVLEAALEWLSEE